MLQRGLEATTDCFFQTETTAGSYFEHGQQLRGLSTMLRDSELQHIMLVKNVHEMVYGRN